MAYKEKEITEIFNKICDRIEKGESLRSVLRSKDMPESKTIFRWMQSTEDKRQQYACACEARADSIFEEIIDISDNLGGDIITTPGGNEIIDHAVIQRDKLRVDTRKWALSKMNPKKYGEKVEIKSTNTNMNVELDEQQKKEALERVKKGLDEFKDYE